MNLTEQEKNDILMFWSGELSTDQKIKVEKLLEENTHALVYLQEIQALDEMPIDSKEEFQPIDVTKLLNQSDCLQADSVQAPSVDSVQLGKLEHAPPTTGKKLSRQKRSFSYWVLAGTGLLAATVIGFAFLQQSSFFKAGSKTVAVSPTSPKTQLLRSKRKRLKWIQTQTRKNRQFTYRHRSTASSRWTELRKRKPRKGLA